MQAEGRPFKGCLYFGLMLTPDGPKVIEYNCRFGDPETQVVLPLLESDLLTVMQAATERHAGRDRGASCSDGAAACVILASRRLSRAPTRRARPSPASTEGQLDAADVTVYHAGTAIKEGKLVTNGGRVLGVTAAARDACREATERGLRRQPSNIHFDKLHMRSDIGAAGAGRDAVTEEYTMVYRIYVRKSPALTARPQGALPRAASTLLGIKALTGLRLLNRYDVEGIDDVAVPAVPSRTVFSEPPGRHAPTTSLPDGRGTVFAVEYLPGQFDQRADSASQCIQLHQPGRAPHRAHAPASTCWRAI